MGFELVCYLNFGYPSVEEAIRYAQLYEKCGCRYLQLDLPLRDPYLENDMVKARMAQLWERYDGYEPFLDGIAEVHRRMPDVKLILMMYEEVIDALGVPAVVRFCKENAIDGMTYVGLHDNGYRQELGKSGLFVANYVRFHLPDSEVAFAKASPAMVLLQAAPEGETRPGYETFADCMRYLREQGIGNSVYASVGIRTPDDIRMVKAAGADGAFVGSTLIKALPDETKLQEALKGFIRAANAPAE